MGIYSRYIAVHLSKLTFEEQQTSLSWIVLVYMSLYNRANNITKYQMVFLREKFFEFSSVIAKEACFSILVAKIPPF